MSFLPHSPAPALNRLFRSVFSSDVRRHHTSPHLCSWRFYQSIPTPCNRRRIPCIASSSAAAAFSSSSTSSLLLRLHFLVDLPQAAAVCTHAHFLPLNITWSLVYSYTITHYHTHTLSRSVSQSLTQRVGLSTRDLRGLTSFRRDDNDREPANLFREHTRARQPLAHRAGRSDLSNSIFSQTTWPPVPHPSRPAARVARALSRCSDS